MDKYLFNLFRQFNEMQGIEYTNFNDPVYFENFCFWLIEQRKCGKIYQDFIQYLGFDIDNPDAVELRKGKYDSIALHNTTIVSPFASSLGKENKELFVFQGEPLIIGSNNKIECQVAETYLTQNPYSRKYLEGIGYFGSLGKEVCIGAFGNLTDRDIEDKIRRIRSYGEETLPYLVEDYKTLDNKYFYVLRTGFKQKRNIKTR